jgi:GntR family transcriptional regulator
MKIWIKKNAEISVREQIVTQVSLGVASRDLLPGDKLPSTRELARRFGIHQNTVSAAYRELAAAKIVEQRRGSGVFVAGDGKAAEAATDIDTLLADFVSNAASAGYSRNHMGAAMERWLRRDDSPRLIVVESDPGLRAIILEEVRSKTGLEAAAFALEDLRPANFGEFVVFAALFDEKEKLAGLLRTAQKAVFLEVNSVPQSLIGADRPPDDDTVAVVSGWERFLAIARVYLLAARIDPDTLIFRSTNEPGWKRGLNSASIVICDSATAAEFPGDERLRVFKLLKDESIEKLQHALL